MKMPHALQVYAFWSMMGFLGILTVGFIYEWKKGALGMGVVAKDGDLWPAIMSPDGRVRPGSGGRRRAFGGGGLQSRTSRSLF